MTEQKKTPELIETSIAFILSALVAIVVFLLGWLILQASGFFRG